MCQDLELNNPFLLKSRTTIEWLVSTNRRFLLVSIPSSDPKCHLLDLGTLIQLYLRWSKVFARMLSGSRYGPFAPASLPAEVGSSCLAPAIPADRSDDLSVS